MNADAVSHPDRDAFAARIAWAAWAAFALATVAVKFGVPPSWGNVFNIYREAGIRWQSGVDLYPADLLFNYFPPSALIFAPLSWMPYDLGGAVLRSLNILVFALGVWRISASSGARSRHSLFLITTVVSILMSWSAARHGQMTLAMAGLMMLAVADVQRGAVWRAALFSTLAVALKPLAVVLTLVLAAVYPRVLWRTAVAIAVVFLLPFLFQDPDYVLSQYMAIPDMLLARAGRPELLQHVFGLLTTMGWVATSFQETLVRGASALVVLALCWRVSRIAPPMGVALALYALTTCYILLLGHGTERNTYAMMAPIIGLLAAQSWHAGNRRVLSLMLALILISLSSHTLQKTFPGTPLAMIKPFACTVLFVFLTWSLTKPASNRDDLQALDWSGAAKPDG